MTFSALSSFSQGWISYAGTHVPMFVPNMCLSSIMGFLHENITLAYFVFLGDRLFRLFSTQM